MSRSTTTTKKSGGRLARHLQPPTKREREALAAATDQQIADILRPEENASTDRVGLVNQKTGETLAVLTVDEYRAFLGWMRSVASAAKEDRSEMSGATMSDTAIELKARSQTASSFSGNKRFRTKAATDLTQLQNKAGSTGTVAVALRALLDGELSLSSVPALAKIPVKLAQATDVNQRHHTRVANARRLIAAYMDERHLNEYQRQQAVEEIIQGLRTGRVTI